ncbi:MAG: HEAT repeat domain-containing protein, partial [Bryobacteraceae bacterium]|nr:HEAT repeat domain-containing protein [Bryobacteraceae bacterium]
MNLAIRLLLLNLPLLGAQTPDPAALVRAVAAYDYGQDRAPLDAVSDLTRASHADPALRARLESALIGLLRGHATNAAKDFACRELSVIGGDASVPALAALLDDAALGAFAIYALERIPGKESAGALAKALPGSSGMTRLGLINALARRGVPNPLFRQWLASGDAQVAAAAAAALGATGDRSDIQRLLNARASNPAAQEAVLRLAGRLGPGGRSVYQALYRPGEPLMARVAALEGLARLDGARAMPAILEALQSPEPALQREAVRLAARHGGRTQLLAALPSQPPSLQVVTLTALSEAGAAEALPAFRAAASSAEPAVRIAAIRALARHGGAKEAALLARIAAESEEAERDEARSALARLRGAPVDAAIVQSISSSEGKVKVELIRAAGERGVAEAAPSLLAAA